MPLRNISDTAAWVAYFRALETERPDALFKDPFARDLAGDVGRRLTHQLGSIELVARGIAVRTTVFDELIMQRTAANGVDLVLNLGAGLDTRPWRLRLPRALRWVDVDLPAILEYKTALMRAQTPSCDYQALPVDLAEEGARAALFSRLDRGTRCVLVVTEGLLLYLTAHDVAALARALHANPSFQWWLTDIVGPKALHMLQAAWGPVFAHANVALQFAPLESTGFFRPYGWREELFRSSLAEARRLHRQAPTVWLSRVLLWFAPSAQREEFRRLSGTALLERAP